MTTTRTVRELIDGVENRGRIDRLNMELRLVGVGMTACAIGFIYADPPGDSSCVCRVTVGTSDIDVFTREAR